MRRAERRGGRWELLRHMRLPLCMFAVLAVLAVAGILLLRSTLLRNAREAATAFARSCAAEEQGNLNVYETLLTFGTSALEKRLEDGEDREQILDFLDMYFQRVDNVLGDGVVDPYVVLDGEILAANPWEGDGNYDYTASPWYGPALEAGGGVVFTSVYADAVSGRPIVTAAQSCRDGTAVMAFDILPEHLRFDTAELTEEDSFFLCDGAGTLIYQETGMALPREELQGYLTWLVNRIQAGELEEEHIIRDLNGHLRGVYYTRMDNGWYCIVTVPYGRILGGLRGLIWPLLLMFGVSFLVVTALAVRERRLDRRARRAGETVQVLSNTYYALYRVDYARETYEMIKGSDYVRERIPAAGRYLLGLINDILEMARMEHGQLQLEQRQFDLRACLEECLGAFRMQAEREGKTLREEFRPESAAVLGDDFRIQQILNNLLSNAFKFTPPGGTVSLSVRRLDGGEYGRYQFVVADTGIGMSPEFLERIFEPYAREMRFSDRQASGTGLGMSITRNLVAQMGGEIQVESAPGKGSTFTVVLPLAPAEGAGGAEAAPSGEAPFSLEGLRLLLAEDNEINMDITAELLSAQGAEVTRAWNGAQAVERFREAAPFSFDAVLMDMQMPEMDGCEAARAIRALDRPDAGTVPIIAVTANVFAEDVSATAAAGMNGHISKPIDLAALRETLEKLCPTAGPRGPEH